MRTNVSKNQNTQLPIQGRADEITPLLDSVASKEELDLLINDFFWEVNHSRGCSDLLRSLLKAGIGEDKSSGAHSLSQVSTILFETTRILKFIRDLGNLIPTLSIEVEVTNLKDLHEKIDYETLDEDVFRALGMWIYDDNHSLACLEYITKMATNFQQVISLFEACEEYKNQINDHGKSL